MDIFHCFSDHRQHIIRKVIDIAIELHGDQLRKYTGDPYWYHVVDVANIYAQAEINSSSKQFFGSNAEDGLFEGILIALLHDTIEDTGVDPTTLELLLKPLIGKQNKLDYIINGVISLTDMYTHKDHPTLNRKRRKEMEALRLSRLSPSIINIKLADLISNTSTIAQHDPDFAVTYMDEKLNLLNLIKDKIGINRVLMTRCVGIISNWNVGPKSNWRATWAGISGVELRKYKEVEKEKQSLNNINSNASDYVFTASDAINQVSHKFNARAKEVVDSVFTNPATHLVKQLTSEATKREATCFNHPVEKVVFANIPGKKDAAEQFIEWSDGKAKASKSSSSIYVVDKNIDNALGKLPVFFPMSVPMSREGKEVGMIDLEYSVNVNDINESNSYILVSDLNEVLSSFNLPVIKHKKFQHKDPNPDGDPVVLEEGDILKQDFPAESYDYIPVGRVDICCANKANWKIFEEIADCFYAVRCKLCNTGFIGNVGESKIKRGSTDDFGTILAEDAEGALE